MKKRQSMIIVALVFLVTAPVYSWELVSTKKGVTVEREIRDDTPVIKFRSRGVVNADVVHILAVLQDVKNAHKWNKNSYNNKIIEKISETEVVVYNVNRVPWPFQDRETLMKVNFKVNEDQRYIVLSGRETKHNLMPPTKGKVRVSLIRMKWYLRPLPKHQGKKTWVEFTLYMDPGGNIPLWLINLVSKKVPYKTILNIRQRVKAPDLDQNFIKKYQRYQNWF